ncbi:hypothetical protein PHYBOEH_010064 [Phytophthora boehmeriae]|uniref:Uncharacterized protein n=1 Tax=Phytophthora boehmeriae TaxID=109152 RepID=A0A8T1X4Z1_9STRA|nr:hypothetical protein PHYBOEH_010064 [Phytophthora boehmeriae]
MMCKSDTDREIAIKQVFLSVVQLLNSTAIDAAAAAEQTKLARELEEQRRKTSETREEVMKCKLAYVEMKGGMNTRATSLKKELDHVQCALECEKTRMSTLQVSITNKTAIKSTHGPTYAFEATDCSRDDNEEADTTLAAPSDSI